MTRYAVDPARRELVRILSTPGGEMVNDIARLEDIKDANIHQQIAVELTELSLAQWHTYTDSASAALDDLSPDTEGATRIGTWGDCPRCPLAQEP